MRPAHKEGFIQTFYYMFYTFYLAKERRPCRTWRRGE
jgi:hypothetical protein